MRFQSVKWVFFGTHTKKKSKTKKNGGKKKKEKEEHTHTHTHKSTLCEKKTDLSLLSLELLVSFLESKEFFSKRDSFFFFFFV